MRRTGGGGLINSQEEDGATNWIANGDREYSTMTDRDSVVTAGEGEGARLLLFREERFCVIRL